MFNMKILVGYTGFVGSNISSQVEFDALFNSKNISHSFNLNPDLCIYAGVKAEKYVANINPVEDLKHIEESFENIVKINPKKLILISTIDVYDQTSNLNEDYNSDERNLNPYGKNRLILENRVLNHFNDVHIVRLPSLFGQNLRKNFIFDIINPIPAKLSSSKFNEIIGKNAFFTKIYRKIDDNFYVIDKNTPITNDEILSNLDAVSFNSLFFTDSRSEFQFYNLATIYKDLSTVVKNSIKKINFVTEPLEASEIYYSIYSKYFKNEVNSSYPKYNLKTKYFDLFNGSNGFIKDKFKVLAELKEFIEINKS
jgi:dTDP-4-dehydrorhamnose reductase